MKHNQMKARCTKLTPLLKTRDMAHTVAFYTEVLGCQVEVLFPEASPTFCVLALDEISFSFSADTHDGDPDPQMTGQLYIEAENVTELFERVRDKAEIRWGLEVFDYGRREFAIRDCNGYTLAFSEPTDEPPTCAEN